MRVLLSAYACEPGKGSEPEVGWRWALGLAARGHEVWVLTRANNRIAIDASLSGACPTNLHFAYFDLPWWGLRLKKLLGTNVYYRLWQLGAADLAARLHALHQFDRAHHVTFVSVRHPSFLRNLGVPYVFGPVAGGEAIPKAFLERLPLTQRISENFRIVATKLLMRAPAMRATIERAERVVVTSPETRDLLPAGVRQHVDVRLAITAAIGDCAQRTKSAPIDRPIRLLFVGRHIPFKGAEIALRAVSLFVSGGAAATLTVVGEGPLEDDLRNLASHLGLDENVTFIRHVARDALVDVYDAHDVLLFPSLRDSGGMVVLEAMERALPVVCLRTGGPGVIVDRTCGYAVEPVTSASTVADIAAALKTLASDAERYRECSAGALARVRAFSAEAVFQAFSY